MSKIKVSPRDILAPLIISITGITVGDAYLPTKTCLPICRISGWISCLKYTLMDEIRVSPTVGDIKFLSHRARALPTSNEMGDKQIICSSSILWSPISLLFAFITFGITIYFDTTSGRNLCDTDIWNRIVYPSPVITYLLQHKSLSEPSDSQRRPVSLLSTAPFVTVAYAFAGRYYLSLLERATHYRGIPSPLLRLLFVFIAQREKW